MSVNWSRFYCTFWGENHKTNITVRKDVYEFFKPFIVDHYYPSGNAMRSYDCGLKSRTNAPENYDKGYEGKSAGGKRLNKKRDRGFVKLKDLLTGNVPLELHEKTEAEFNNKKDRKSKSQATKCEAYDCQWPLPIDADTQLKLLHEEIVHDSKEEFIDFTSVFEEIPESYLNLYWCLESQCNIFSKIPADILQKYKHLFFNISDEIRRFCTEAGKKVVLDSVLSDEKPRTRLNIHKYPIPFHVCVVTAPVPWHQYVLNARNYAFHNLFLTNPVLSELNQLWYKEYSGLRAVPIEKLKSFLPLDIAPLEKLSLHFYTDAYELLTKRWIPQCAELLRKNSSHWINILDENCHRNANSRGAKFFRCINAFMSLQLKKFVMNSVEDLLKFLSAYKDGNDVTRKPNLYPNAAFIKLVVDVDFEMGERKVVIRPTDDEVYRFVRNFFNKIISTSENIPAVEQLLFPEISEFAGNYLRSMRVTEHLIQIAQHEAYDICSVNLIGPKQFLRAYDWSSAIISFSEKTDLTAAIENIDSRDLIELIVRMENYVSLKKKLSANSVFMNMMYLECDKGNEKICDIIDDLCNDITDYFTKSSFANNKRISKEFEKIAEAAGKIVETTEELVALNEYILQTKTVKLALLNKDLALNSKRVLFLVDYAKISDKDVTLNAKLFSWPKELRDILDLAKNRLKQKRLVFENALRIKREDFAAVLSQREDEVKKLKKRDPPLLTISEIKEMAASFQNILQILTKDKEIALAINKEESLLELDATSYHNLDEMVESVLPRCQLWQTVLQFHIYYDKWFNGPCIELNSQEIRNVIQDISSVFSQLSKSLGETCGHSKRIIGTLASKVEKFQEYIPVLETICNPGLRDRHWKAISDIAGVEVILNERLTLAEAIHFGLNKYVSNLREINARATEEYELELNLDVMKAEWSSTEVECISHREGDMRILRETGSIQTLLDDHLMRVQSMRSSPYVRAIEENVRNWEEELIFVQDTFDLWIKVQSNMVYLEPLFDCEDIMRQMPEECEEFASLNKTWSDIMDHAQRHPLVLTAILYPRMMEVLNDCASILERIRGRLRNYLEKKRCIFPRFYFLSHQEMLEILSESGGDYARIRSHTKCFPGIAELRFTDEADIVAIVSSQGEIVPLTSAVNVADSKGVVERWLEELQDSMVQSISELINKAIESFGTTPLIDWITQLPAMGAEVALHIYFTRKIENSINERTLENCLGESKCILKQLILSTGNYKLGFRIRNVVSSLIQIIIYINDIIEDLMDRNVSRVTDFNWIKRLRYYKEEEKVVVKMLFTSISYGYEYLGDTRRFVFTTFAQQSYRLIFGSMREHFYPAVLGGCNTGKTETCADFAKAVGKPFYYFNCRGTFSRRCLTNFFKGCVQTGSFLCLDGMDGLPFRQLSAIGEMMISLRSTLVEKERFVKIDRVEIPVNNSCGIFCTFQSVEIANERIPENMKSVLRPICTMEPITPSSDILKSRLQSRGISNYELFADKIVSAFKLCERFIPYQTERNFLDFRSTELIFKLYEKEKERSIGKSENFILLSAMKSYYEPSIYDAVKIFFSRNIPTLNGILEDVFTETSSDEIDSFFKCIRDHLNENNAEASDYSIRKIMQLHQALQTSRGVILLGSSMSGKSFTFRHLSAILSKLDKNHANYKNVRCTVLNVSATNSKDLFGYYDVENEQWIHGILSATFQDVKDDASCDKWIIFDGPLDASWIRAVNSALDETSRICPLSDETIMLRENVKILFETDDVRNACVETLNRCRIILFEGDEISWTWLLTDFSRVLSGDKRVNTDQIRCFEAVVRWLFPPVLHFARQRSQLSRDFPDNFWFRKFSNLFQALMENHHLNAECGFANSWINCNILFSIVWALAANLGGELRTEFDCYLRSLLSGEVEAHPKPSEFKSAKITFPESLTVFEWVCDTNGSWVTWQNVAKQMPTNDLDATKIVPTAEVTRQWFFLQKFLAVKRPVLMIGPSCSGKSAGLSFFQSTLPSDEYVANRIVFSKYSSLSGVRDMVLAKIDRRRKGIFGPPMGKKCVIFADDLDAAPKNQSQVAESLEFIRRIIRYNCIYDSKNGCKIELVDVAFVGAANDISSISPRFLNGVNFIYSHPLNDVALTEIFAKMLHTHFSNGFTKQLINSSRPIVESTMDVYNSLKENASFPKYDANDVRDVVTGLMAISPELCETTDEMLRLWIHELLRVFFDRMSGEEETELSLEYVKRASYRNLRQKTDEYLNYLITDEECGQLRIRHLKNLFFGAYVTNGRGETDFDEIPDTRKLTEYMKNSAVEYCSKYNAECPAILLKFTVQHAHRLLRAFSSKKKHVLLIGFKGSGQRTAVKLAVAVQDIPLFSVNGENKREWRTHLKNLFLDIAGKDEKHALLVSDEHLTDRDEIIWEDLSCLLSHSDLPVSYSQEERSRILDQMTKAMRKKDENIDVSPWSLYDMFTSRVKNNLRIILLTGTNSVESKGMKSFMDFSKYCCIDYFTCWSDEDLRQLLGAYIEDIFEKTGNSDASVWDKCVKMCVRIHRTCIDERFSKLFQERGVVVNPSIFMKFLRTFKMIFRRKIAGISSKKDRYDRGLERLDFVADQVKKMRAELLELKPQLLLTSETTEKLMVKIEHNTICIETTKEIVAADECLANEAAAAAQAIRDDCESDLNEAEPALLSATNALDTLKPADIIVVKSMKNPPSVVKLVLEAVCVMKGLKPERVTESGLIIQDYWITSLKLLGDAKFLENLKNYDKDNIDEGVIKIIRERYIPHRNFDPNIVKKVSNACEGLCKWVRAMEIYDRVIHIVGPKKVKLLQAEAHYTAQMEKLGKKRSQLAEVMSKLQTLRDELAEKSKRKGDLQDSIQQCSEQLERAEKLIGCVGSEKLRWRETSRKLGVSLKECVGDVVLSSAIVAYLAPLPHRSRKIIMQEWKSSCQRMEFPLKENFSASSTLLADGDTADYALEFPMDAGFADNIAIALNSFPLVFVYDPQGLAKKFILKTAENDDVMCLNASDFKAKEFLEKAFAEDKIVIMEEDGDFDFSLDFCSIFCDKFINDDRWELSPKLKSFKLYVISGNNGCFYRPEIYNKFILLDFSITMEGLREQLFNLVVSNESPATAEKQRALLSAQSQTDRSIDATEDEILNLLSSCEGSNILQDESALNTLNASKNLLWELQSKKEDLSMSAKKLILEMDVYQSVAIHATNVIYLAVHSLPLLNSSYRFSLDWLIRIYTRVLHLSENPGKPDARKWAIRNSLLETLYKKMSPSLLEDDKKYVAFFLILQDAHVLTHAEHDLNVFINELRYDDHNITDWYSDELFLDWLPREKMMRLKTDLRKHVVENVEFWERIYQCNAFEDIAPSFQIHSKQNALQLMSILKNLRPDLFDVAISKYAQELTEDVECRVSYLNKLYGEADDEIPMLVILYRDDLRPFKTIERFAKDIGVVCVRFSLSVIKKTETIREALDDGMLNGKWLVFENYASGPEEMAFLRRVCKIVSRGYHHGNFRIWFTNPWRNDFPEDVLLLGTKFIMEEKRCFEWNFKEAYATFRLDPVIAAEFGNNKIFPIFACHAHLRLTKKFHSGKNGNHIFNFTDVNLAINISHVLAMRENKNEISDENMRYLLGDCNYVGNFGKISEVSRLREILELVFKERRMSPDASVNDYLKRLSTF